MRAFWSVLARCFVGLSVAVCLAGWAAWKWFTGAPWRSRYRGRRLVTRPVRAVGQSAATAIGVGLVLDPILTAAVLAVLGLALVGSAAAWRYRERVASRVVVEVGEPLRPPVWRADPAWTAPVVARPLRELERAS